MRRIYLFHFPQECGARRGHPVVGLFRDFASTEAWMAGMHLCH